MTFYSDLAATAKTLIRDKGQAIVLTRNTPSANVSGASPLTPSLLSTYGVVLDYPSKEVGPLVLSTDKKVIMESTYEPTMQDYLTIGGVRHGIVGVKKLAPAGTAVIYTVQARTGG